MSGACDSAKVLQPRLAFFLSFFIRHNWKPALAIDASITPRLRLWGGAVSGRTTPIACQGRNCAGSLPPPWSSEKACKPGLVSDLKIKMRMVEDPVAILVQNLRPRAAGLAGMGLPLASSRGFLGGALISPSKIAFLRAALRSRRTASLFSRAACSDGFS